MCWASLCCPSCWAFCVGPTYGTTKRNYRNYAALPAARTMNATIGTAWRARARTRHVNHLRHECGAGPGPFGRWSTLSLYFRNVHSGNTAATRRSLLRHLRASVRFRSGRALQQRPKGPGPVPHGSRKTKRSSRKTPHDSRKTSSLTTQSPKRYLVTSTLPGFISP